MLKVPSTIHKIETMSDGGLKMTVYTQELATEDEAEVMKLKRQLGWFVFAVTEQIKQEDIPTEQLDFPSDKSPSQRLKAVFYRLWEQNKEGYKEFEGYYRGKMDALIEHFKEKIV